MIKIYRFRVYGRGPFPVDMLRHDCCYPADTTSAFQIMEDASGGIETYRKVREVVLITNMRLGPTVERWRSFGWSCNDIEELA